MIYIYSYLPSFWYFYLCILYTHFIHFVLRWRRPSSRLRRFGHWKTPWWWPEQCRRGCKRIANAYQQCPQDAEKGKLAIASDVFLDSVKKRRSEWLYVAKGVLEPLCRLSSSMTHRGASGPAEPEVQRESADHQFAESKWDWGRICKLCKLQRMPKSMVSPWFRLRFQVGWWFDSARKSRPWRSSRVQPTRSCSRKRRHRKCPATPVSRCTAMDFWQVLSQIEQEAIPLGPQKRSVQCSTFIRKLGLCKVLL